MGHEIFTQLIDLRELMSFFSRLTAVFSCRRIIRETCVISAGSCQSTCTSSGDTCRDTALTAVSAMYVAADTRLVLCYFAYAYVNFVKQP